MKDGGGGGGNAEGDGAEERARLEVVEAGVVAPAAGEGRNFLADVGALGDLEGVSLMVVGTEGEAAADAEEDEGGAESVVLGEETGDWEASLRTARAERPGIRWGSCSCSSGCSGGGRGD